MAQELGSNRLQRYLFSVRYIFVDYEFYSYSMFKKISFDVPPESHKNLSFYGFYKCSHPFLRLCPTESNNHIIYININYNLSLISIIFCLK